MQTSIWNQLGVNYSWLLLNEFNFRTKSEPSLEKVSFRTKPRYRIIWNINKIKIVVSASPLRANRMHIIRIDVTITKGLKLKQKKNEDSIDRGRYKCYKTYPFDIRHPPLCVWEAAACALYWDLLGLSFNHSRIPSGSGTVLFRSRYLWSGFWLTLSHIYARGRMNAVLTHDLVTRPELFDLRCSMQYYLPILCFNAWLVPSAWQLNWANKNKWCLSNYTWFCSLVGRAVTD